MKLDWSLYSKTMKKPTNLVKKEEKQTTYEEDYNELLNDLAEARNAANQLRAELWKDDSSPFNPPLTEDEAYCTVNLIMDNTIKSTKFFTGLVFCKLPGNFGLKAITFC